MKPAACSVAVKANGEVLAWGSGRCSGKASPGDGAGPEWRQLPTIPGLGAADGEAGGDGLSVKAVAVAVDQVGAPGPIEPQAAQTHVLVLLSDGRLLTLAPSSDEEGDACGAAWASSLDLLGRTCVLVPAEAAAGVVHVSASGDRVLAITRDGAAVSWSNRGGNCTVGVSAAKLCAVFSDVQVRRGDDLVSGAVHAYPFDSTQFSVPPPRPVRFLGRTRGGGVVAWGAPSAGGSGFMNVPDRATSAVTAVAVNELGAFATRNV